MENRRTATTLSLMVGIGVGVIMALLLLDSGTRISLNLGDIRRVWLAYPLVLALTAIALTLLLWPILYYRRYGQSERMERIRSYYSSEVIAAYFNRFLTGRDAYTSTVRKYRTSSPDSDERRNAERELSSKFDDFLLQTFGHDRIGQAIVFLGVVAAVVLFFAFEGGVMLAIQQGPQKETAHYLLGIQPDVTSLAAIFGAYTWVASDIIFRFRQSDFNSSDVLWYALRFVVAVPLGAALAAYAPMKGSEIDGVVTGSSGPVLAFVVGTFSLSRIQQILTSFTNRAFKIPGAAEEERDDVAIKLPGVDQNVADRLQAEGITTIAQIAASDPIRLSSRTNIPFGLVLEFIDEAILWTLIGSKLLIVREFGWAGASHIVGFADRRADGIQPLLDDCLQKTAEAQAQARLCKEAGEKLAAAKAVLGLAEQSVTADMAQDNPARQRLADAQAALEQCKTSLAQQEAARNQTMQAREEARKAIAAASLQSDVIFEDVAAKADMKISAVRGIVEEIARNEYARFVLRMMQVGATSSAAPESTWGQAAVPA